jgi:hypothetical protein
LEETIRLSPRLKEKACGPSPHLYLTDHARAYGRGSSDTLAQAKAGFEPDCASEAGKTLERRSMMRTYLSTHPQIGMGAFSPDDLDVLDELMRCAVKALHITDEADRNEIAARIFAIYTLGGLSKEQILATVARLHQQGFSPGGRRSDTSTPKRIRTERQRRKLARQE